MIKEVAGDILLTKAQAIAHGIAPNDHYNSGLALSLREEWPAMYRTLRTPRLPEPHKPGRRGLDHSCTLSFNAQKTCSNVPAAAKTIANNVTGLSISPFDS